MAEARRRRFAVDVAGLAAGQTRAVDVGGTRVLLCNVAGSLHAVENRCPHADFPLSDGCMRGHLLECPLHGGRFDVRTGEPVRAPTRRPLRVFALHAGDGGAEIEIGGTAIEPPGDGPELSSPRSPRR